MRCSLCPLVAQTERVGVQLVFSEEGEEALMRSSWDRVQDASYSDHSGDECNGWTSGTRRSSHHWLRTHTTFHRPAIYSPSAPRLCDKDNNWVTFHSITARLPGSASDEATSTVNCQAELIGTRGRSREWRGNWNELEWKERLWEWEDLEPRRTHLRFLFGA